jgi:hypothetical protein
MKEVKSPTAKIAVRLSAFQKDLYDIVCAKIETKKILSGGELAGAQRGYPTVGSPSIKTGSNRNLRRLLETASCRLLHLRRMAARGYANPASKTKAKKPGLALQYNPTLQAQ